MKLIILPVSGGCFVSQLYMVSIFCRLHYIPDVVLSSSGGNVVAYLATAAEWNFYKLCFISKYLNKNFFNTCWNNIMTFSIIIGYFQGTLFDKGKGVREFFERNFTQNLIQKQEIWTEAYNKTKNKTRLFCNRNANDTILKVTSKAVRIHNMIPPYFADGDVEKIANYSIASASIPTIVPPQEINNEMYVDGGVSSPSPFHLLEESILRKIQETNDSLHMIYVNIEDLESNKLQGNNNGNLIHTYRNLVEDILNNQKIKDRTMVVHVLKILTKDNITGLSFSFSEENIKKYLKVIEFIDFSFLEVFPKKKICVDLFNFSKEEIEEKIKEVKEECMCRFMFDASKLEEIKEILIGDIIDNL